MELGLGLLTRQFADEATPGKSIRTLINLQTSQLTVGDFI